MTFWALLAIAVLVACAVAVLHSARRDRRQGRHHRTHGARDRVRYGTDSPYAYGTATVLTGSDADDHCRHHPAAGDSDHASDGCDSGGAGGSGGGGGGSD